jgi:hypothetical protein
MWLASGLEVEPDDFQPYVCPNCFAVYNLQNFPLGGWHWCVDNVGEYQQQTLVPLSRQDQLQGMLPTDILWSLSRCATVIGQPFKGGIKHKANYQYRNKLYNYDLCGETPEQALIQGVMHELHSKTWDGERWVT